MRRNRKSSIKKERIIMITSSAFVLAALTMAGVYMKEQNVESRDDGYSMDYAALENSVDDKFTEIAQNSQLNEQDNYVALGNAGTETDVTQENLTTEPRTEPTNMEDDLDYMPMEVGSSLVEIEGLTEGAYTLQEEELADVSGSENEEEFLAENPETAMEEQVEEAVETSGQNAEVIAELNFSEENGLVRPVTGDILMHYSMDGSVYFATLDQYKYNPAVMFSAEEGSAVSAGAAGKVVDIYEDAQIGHAVVIDLGDGYQATYGQLKDIQVTVDSYVEAGETIGSVAAPTKYFSVEGANLYFQLTKDGNPINPEELF